ncbi:hypothetical protein [Paenibacillus taichungensis]|nr:hypothetical protein [Paenibacillus taichungensis]
MDTMEKGCLRMVQEDLRILWNKLIRYYGITAFTQANREFFGWVGVNTT